VTWFQHSYWKHLENHQIKIHRFLPCQNFIYIAFKLRGGGGFTLPPILSYHYIYTLLVYLFVFNKRQNGCTDPAQFFCGTSNDPREDLWRIKISTICLWVWQNSISNKFSKSTVFFMKSAHFYFVFVFNLFKEKMLTI